jgi:hypothetical protein
MRGRMKKIKFFVFIVLAFFCLAVCPTVWGSPQVIGQVVWVKGTVHAISADNKKRVLQRRAAIYEQDQIVTSSTGTGEVVFTDGGILSIRADSAIRMSEYKFNKTNPSSNDKFVVEVVKGGFRTITGVISKSNPEGYQVNTPVATIGIRGTHYSTYYKSCQRGAKDCGLSLKIESGSITVKNSQGELVLQQGSNRMYAKVGSSVQAPVSTSQEPAVFENDVPLQPAAFEGPGLGMVTTGGDINGGSATSSGIDAPSTITGPAKTVSGFCLQ